MAEKIKVALVDDEVLIRQGLKNFLSQEDDFDVLFDVSNGLALIRALEENTDHPDIILMDINMPECNGIEATNLVTARYPDIKIVALSSYNSESFKRKMISIGAVCYLPKNCNPSDLIFRLHKVYSQGFYYEDHMLSYIRNRSGIENSLEISDREKEVLHLICLQKSSTEIAAILHISPRTVDNHRNSLLQKTESKNIIGLVIYAIQHQLYLPEE